MPREYHFLDASPYPGYWQLEAHIESSDEESVGEAIPFHNKEDEETKPIKDEEKDDQNGEEDEDDEDDEADEADEDV